MTTPGPEVRTARTAALDDELRTRIVQLCVDAHQEEDFRNLFRYLPDDGLHVLVSIEDAVVGHAVVTTRWLQVGTTPVMRTAYVDAVATAPSIQGRGVGSRLMRHLETAVADFDIACLETESPAFYQRLGWEIWRGPLAGRTAGGLVLTPDQKGVMILRLPLTPLLDLDQMLSVEANEFRIW